MKKFSINIGWMYPDLMSTYGDRGNIIVLKKRAEARNIDVKVTEIFIDTSTHEIDSCDLIFMGGAQDTQQEIVTSDLLSKKGEALKSKIENNTPGLYICGAYQFLGKFYKTADGKELKGLGIFPLHTTNPGVKAKRLIGNVLVSTSVEGITQPLVGFENHGGRTYLDDKSYTLGNVIQGSGNNGEDNTEGVSYKNSIGTYLHGPILPKNPELTDYLIKKALEVKYGTSFDLEKIDDLLEEHARQQVIKLRLQ